LHRKFLKYFGLLRELYELRRRVDEAVATKGTQKSGELTYAEYLRESGLGEDEWQGGKIGAAYTRFSSLLARIETLPVGASLGPGSYEHCCILHRLARCLDNGGQPAAAEGGLRKALAVIEALLSQQPEDESYLRERSIVLNDLADVLTNQGKYSQAREATVWHQLGMIAEGQQAWAEAERCYRESLAIKERLGNATGAANSCNQLAIVSVRAGHTPEAEGWWKRG
jgi:tetratricopeptide (TPR) repeat protein